MIDEKRRYIGQICYLEESFLVGIKDTFRVELTSSENTILSLLIDLNGHILTKKSAAENLWGSNYSADNKDEDNIRYHIINIRNKLNLLRDGLGHDCVITKRGYGYCLAEEYRRNVSEQSDPSLSLTFSRGRGDNAERAFSRPSHFMEPQAAQALLENAFSGSEVHMICGQRGMGKTELARYFAYRCCTDKDIRRELKYENVLFTTYCDDGLEATIALLPWADGTEAPKDRSQANQEYAIKLEVLKTLKKPCLLIIDNYDNENSYREELSAHCRAYRDLLDTGCHILLTSRIDGTDCYGVESTRIRPLQPQDRIRLFRRHADDADLPEDDAGITDLIDRCLLGNTYLIILAAKLMRTKTPEELIQAFEDLSVGDITDRVSAQKEGKKQDSASMLEHYRRMFELSAIRSDLCKCSLMYNLALLPPDGVNYDDFFRDAVAPEETGTMKKAFEQLLESFWVMIRSKRIFLHPLVREMIIAEQQVSDYPLISRYIRSINRCIGTEYFTKELSSQLQLGMSAYAVMEKQGICNFDTAQLCANLCSGYDLLMNGEMIWHYGKKALPLLDAILKNGEEEDPVILASCYSVVGYGLLHVPKIPLQPEETAPLVLAEYALSTTITLIGKIPEDRHSTEVKVQITKLQGNLAAAYLVKQNYRRALELHRGARDFRQTLLPALPNPEGKALLAASYKGIGTALFYLAGEADAGERYDLLKDSYENHRQAAALYSQAGHTRRQETVIAHNRMAGTGIQMIKAEGCPLDDTQLRSLVRELMERMQAATSFLCSVTPIPGEIKNTLSNTAALVSLAKERKLAEEELLTAAGKIADSLGTIGCREQKDWEPYYQTIREALYLSREKVHIL